ncbi:MAG: HD domain-containing protein [Erysipelotrichaceae bacterium]|jgi:HD superfamily phosphohydrolase|nr:HD domain-containing protein [Erysipelotrichaceae bacterium]
MFTRLPEEKVIRDPIHEYIHVEYQIIWDCINACEFQRLRHIRQLGSAVMVYPTAEHSRFSHSLGAYEICRRLLKEVKGLQVSSYDEVAVLLAALLHDLGHGPFSHSFEAISRIHHEEMTKRLLLGPSEIFDILKKGDKDLPQAVAAIIDHSHANPLLTQLISSQLDVDRMDYLLRDAYCTGTTYGDFDLERIIRTLRTSDNKLVIKQSGMHAIEDYIMARYHMYWQVYYHPVSRSYEILLSKLFERLFHNSRQDPFLVSRYPMFGWLFQKEEPSLKEFIKLQDAACLYGFGELCEDEDPILRDLADRLLNRRLFGYQDYINEQQQKQITKKVEAAGYDVRYYLATDSYSQTPYTPYKESGASVIWVLGNDNKVHELSEVSLLVKAIIHGEVKQDHKIYYPKEVKP